MAGQASTIDPVSVPTGMFYISVFESGAMVLPEDRRLFIGTYDEALEELLEEFKELFPDDYDRVTNAQKIRMRTELILHIGNSTQIYGRDVLGNKIVRIERYGPMS